MRTSYAATIHDYNILILCNKMVTFFIVKVRFSTSIRLNVVVTCIVMYIWCGCMYILQKGVCMYHNVVYCVSGL